MYMCLGALSTTPYFLSGLGVNIYSMDELCYYLCVNAYILDNDLIDVRDFVDVDCVVVTDIAGNGYIITGRQLDLTI